LFAAARPWHDVRIQNPNEIVGLQMGPFDRLIYAGAETEIDI
jgi:hypothetical protein